MGIYKMKMVSIIGKENQLDHAIAAYLKSGCFHPETASTFAENVKGFRPVTGENPFSAPLQRLTKILSSVKVKPEIKNNSNSNFTLEEMISKMETIEERLGFLVSDKEKIELELKQVQSDLDKLSHFSELNVNLSEAFGAKYVRFRFGRLPIESYDKLKFYNSNPYVNFFACKEEPNYIWGMYVAPKKEIKEVDSIFASLLFEKMFIPNANGTPKQAIQSFKKTIEDLNHKLTQINEIIDEFNAVEFDEYLELYTQLKSAYETFEVRRYATTYGETFLLVGWIAADRIDYFETFFSSIEAIEISYNDPNEVHTFNPPVKLKNSKLVRPFEMYIEMFGVPNYNEIDPTPFMAIAYTLLFGIMFADVGQGLALALFGYLLNRFKNWKLGAILVPCGLSSAFFGLILGSVFGFEHWLDPLYTAIGLPGKPLEVMHDITTILLLAVVIGVILITVAMIFNIITCLKQKKLGSAIFSENGLCGLLIYIGIIALVLSFLVPSFAWVSNFALPFVIIALVGVAAKEPLAHILNKEGPFKPENGIGELIVQSLFEAFEAVLSYVTNTVSFLRLGAFVLVHFGFMLVFFQLAEMMPGPVLYWFMIVFGNIFVLGLEGLFVSIQSLRLMFYEMFSRFYAGEGKPFSPVNIENK